jgi:hypothetical protein
MKTPRQIRDEVIDLLLSIADETKWPVPPYTIGKLVEHHVKTWQDEISAELTRLYKDWESRVDEDDTLYTLGLRRAQDVVRGEEEEE